MACIVTIVEVFPKTIMVGHCAEVEDKVTTTYEVGIYQAIAQTTISKAQISFSRLWRELSCAQYAQEV